MSSNGLVANAIGAAQEARIKTEQVNRLTAQLADAEQNVKDLQEMLRLNAQILAQQTDAARAAEGEAAEWKRIADDIERRYDAIVPQQKLRDERIADLTAYWVAARRVVDAAKIIAAKYAPMIEWLDRRLAHGDTIAASGPLETYIAERALRHALDAFDTVPDAGKQT